MNAQKFNPGFTSYFNIGYLDVNRHFWTSNPMDLTSYFNIEYLDVNQYLWTSNQMIFICVGF